MSGVVFFLLIAYVLIILSYYFSYMFSDEVLSEFRAIKEKALNDWNVMQGRIDDCQNGITYNKTMGETYEKDAKNNFDKLADWHKKCIDELKECNAGMEKDIALMQAKIDMLDKKKSNKRSWRDSKTATSSSKKKTTKNSK